MSALRHLKVLYPPLVSNVTMMPGGVNFQKSCNFRNTYCDVCNILDYDIEMFTFQILLVLKHGKFFLGTLAIMN